VPPRCLAVLAVPLESFGCGTFKETFFADAAVVLDVAVAAPFAIPSSRLEAIPTSP